MISLFDMKHQCNFNFVVHTSCKILKFMFRQLFHYICFFSMNGVLFNYSKDGELIDVLLELFLKFSDIGCIEIFIDIVHNWK